MHIPVIVRSFRCMLVLATSLALFSPVATFATNGEFSAKIIAGTLVPASNYPAVAQVFIGDSICTGTLITPNYVLTAAHCFFDDNNNRADSQGVEVVFSSGTVQSKSVTIHPSYVSRSEACISGEVDAALIELSQSMSGITPVGLAHSAATAGTSMTLVGYGIQGSGASGENGTFPADGYVNYGYATVDELDATYITWAFTQAGGGSNTAGGDSGGPAFINENGATVIGGITCGGTGNAGFNTYSYDTRGDVIASWADGITGGGTTPPVIGLPQYSGPKTASAVKGKKFSLAVKFASGTASSIKVSNLPTGLRLIGSTIQGTPSRSGTYNVTIRGTNSSGSASITLRLTITAYAPYLSVTQSSLVFGDEEYIDILSTDGKIRVGSAFNPKGKKVVVKMGSFSKTFTLDATGKDTRNSSDTFTLVGSRRNGVFTQPLIGYKLRLSSSAAIAAISSLGFPDVYTAEPDETQSLPISITINGVPASKTSSMMFDGSDNVWYLD